MKKKTYVLSLLIVAAAILYCDNSTEPDENPAYLPLTPGNEWYFVNQSDTLLTLTYRVLNRQPIEGQTYYQYGTGVNNADWIRLENDKIYKRKNDKDFIWYDFTLQEGNTYEHNPTGRSNSTFVYTVTVDRGVSVQAAGKERKNCIVFTFDATPDKDGDELEYTFAPEIGMIRMVSAYAEYHLESYKLQ